MNARELARQASKEYKKQGEKSSSFNDRLSYLPKFDDGEERILRILPPKEAFKWLMDHPDKFFDDYTNLEIGPGAAWEDTYQHFNIGSGGTSLPCLKHVGKPCPPCEAYDEDIKSDNAAIKASANEIRCQHKVSFLVEWRGHKEEGPFDWSMSPTWATDLTALIANNDYTLMYDPFKGHDIRVTRTGSGRNDTNYRMDIRPDETYLYATPDPEDDEFEIFDFEKGKQILAILPDLTELQKPVLDYDAYKAILNNEMTVKEAYQAKFGKSDGDDGTDFDPEKIERESAEPVKRKRRQR